MTEPTPT